MQAIGFSENSLTIYQTIQRHILAHSNLHVLLKFGIYDDVCIMLVCEKFCTCTEIILSIDFMLRIHHRCIQRALCELQAPLALWVVPGKGPFPGLRGG
jgi:HKD family nuclease